MAAGADARRNERGLKISRDNFAHERIRSELLDPLSITSLL